MFAVWEILLVLAAIAVTAFLITLPPAYSHFETGHVVESDFSEADRKDANRSGYDYFSKHKDDRGRLRKDVSVQVVVLGDIGRSPRMQYHALSIAAHGGHVTIVGYVESEVHPDIQAHRFIDVVPIRPFPRRLATDNRLLFLLLAPFKVLWQVLYLYHALAYHTAPSKWMLVQNPPSIPTLAVAQFASFFRRTNLVIDWHNFGFSILALRLGNDHPLVRISRWYERTFSKGAAANFAVTDAMARVLAKDWDLRAAPLHDRPPNYFQPLSHDQRIAFRQRCPKTKDFASQLEASSWRLIVSSTSWTSDEDFSILLDALVSYSAAVQVNERLPKILALITGKGPQKELYLSKIRDLTQQGKLNNVVVETAWLSTDDYASLLGAADLGISLHTSSSGVDLPMKVVDMFGAALPVVGWSKFEAWPELVQEGVNGCGFENADGMFTLLKDLFGGDGKTLGRLKAGALKESHRRWDDEWMPVAGRLFELKP